MKKSEALKILGLNNGATDDEIKKAHREKVIENHPDKVAQDPVKKEAAEEATKKINEARDVLLSGKWEPEFGGIPYGNPYGNPFGGYPGGRPSGGGPEGNPFGGGWPFGGQGQGQSGPAWVWTSWDDVRQGGVGSDPFNPFASAYAVKEKTPEQKLEETKEELKRALGFIVFKLVLATVLFAGGMWGPALFSYAALTLVYVLFKRYGSCLLFLAIPLLLGLARPVIAVARIPIVGIICTPFTVGALIYDGVSMARIIKRYRKALKEVPGKVKVG